jgi:hypothetical protein
MTPTNGAVAVVQDSIMLSFTDHATHNTSNPEASSSFLVQHIVNLTSVANTVRWGKEVSNINYDVIMNGFDIKMHCDPAKQAAGDVCNSNGAWPVKVDISVDCGNTVHLEEGSSGELYIQCNVSLHY